MSTNETQAHERISEDDLEHDTDTLYAMAGIYCMAKHPDRQRNERSVCGECAEIIAYSVERTRKCPFGHKANCQDCDVHCYGPGKREAIRDIMKFAAPRMLVKHPVMTMRYLRKKLSKR